MIVSKLSLAMIFAALPLPAHHSFAAEFDYKKVVQLQGTVTQMEWVNPHTVIHVAVKNADGSLTDWMIEGNTPNSLLRAGLTKRSLEPGTEIKVQGYRSRSGDNIASASAITVKSGNSATPLVHWVSSDEELWRLQLEASK